MVKRLVIQILLIAAWYPLTGEARVIRCAADLTTALRNPSETNCTFDLTATITYICTNGVNEVTTMAAADETGASLFRAEDHRCLAAFPCRGDRAQLTGFIEQGVHGYRFAILTSFRPLQSGSLPAFVTLTIDDLLDPRSDFTLCQTSGLLTDAAYSTTTHYWIILELSDGPSRIFAVVPSFGSGEIERLSRLIGRQISATGIGVPYDHDKRPRIGRLLKIASIDDIRPVHGDDTPPSSELPFVESIQIKSPTEFATLGPHRARGHVVAAWHRGHAILRTKNGEMIGIELIPGAELPACGDYIEASGLPTTDLIHLNLYNSMWQKLDQPSLPQEKPMVVSIAQLMPVSDKNYKQLLFCLYHGRAIRFTGIVRSVTSENEGRQLYVESDGHLVPVETSAIPTAPDASVGCKVDVTGTCVLDVNQLRAGSLFHRIRGFVVVLRTSADLQVISRPPWWTPGRLMALFGFFAIALFGTIFWNISLNRRAKAKGRELAAEQLAHVTSELKVSERTRLAVELHDALSQTLTGVSMQIDTAAGFAAGKAPVISKCLDIASRTIDACRTELRNTLWDLRSAALDEPNMDAAIRKTLCQNLAGVDLSVRFNVPRETFSDNTAHAILKIVRELATNALRHGKATSLKIAGAIEDDKLLFSVRDNGCGFDPSLAPSILQGHFGLQGISERLERLDGKMKIESTTGKGTKVIVTLPIPRSGE